MRNDYDYLDKINWKFIIGITIGFLAVIFIITLFSIYVVPAGNVGIYDLFGNANDNEIYPGLHFKNPLAHIETMSVKTQEYTMSINEEGDVKGRSDTISALTKEGLSVDLDITVLYRLEPSKASDIYKGIEGNYRSVLVRPKIREAIRSVIARYDAKMIYSEDRAKAQIEIMDEISFDLTERGIIIEKVLLRNVQLPEKIRSAISDKLAAEQDSERMEFILTKEEKEAERKVVEAYGVAEAQDIIDKTLTNEYLVYLWINELDSHNSVIYVPIGDNGMPLFKNVDDVNNYKEVKNGNP